MDNKTISSSLLNLISHDLYSEDGLISAMSRDLQNKGNDIPAVQELLQNLELALNENLVITTINQNHVFKKIPDKDSIYILEEKKIILFREFCQQRMAYDYFWSVTKLPKIIENEKGMLVFMYSIETFSDQPHIFPEWYNLFCWGTEYKTFFPQTIMRSMIKEKNFDDNACIEMSLLRAKIYGFNTDSMVEKLKQADEKLKKTR
jgi:hypothetical protein